MQACFLAIFDVFLNRVTGSICCSLLKTPLGDNLIKIGKKMRQNTQIITRALLAIALLSIFSVAMAVDVTNILDLWNVRTALSGSYTQTADIDLSVTNPANLLVWVASTNYSVGNIRKHPTDGYAYWCKTGNSDATFTAANWTRMWQATKGWEPIGNGTTPFTGIYNGANFTISNLYINRKATTTDPYASNTDGEDNVGLFGLVQSVSGSTINTEIKFVKLTNVNVSGRRATGSLIGKVLLPSTAGKTVITSWCSAFGGTVSGFGATGGLVGANNSDRKQNVPFIKYSFSNVTVSSTHPTNTSLNLADSFGKPIKYNPYNIKYGGVVGCNENGVTSDSYAWGPVSGGDRVGGVAGCTINGSIIRCYAIGSPLVQNIYSTAWEGGVGGITGRTAGNLPPGLGGATSNGSVDNSYYDVNIVITSIGGPILTNIGDTSGPRTSIKLTSAPGTYSDTFVNWDPAIWYFNSGDVPIFQGDTPPAYYYRTIGNGNWSDPDNWMRSPNGSTGWVLTSVYPDFSNSVSIAVMGTMTVDVDVSVDQTTVFLNASVTISSGITFKVVNGDGTDLDNAGTITVDVNGTMIIDQGAGISTNSVINNNGALVNSGSISWQSISSVSSGTSSTIIYNGVTAQNTGTYFPISINDMVINNITEPETSAKVTFTTPFDINGTLTVTRGTVENKCNTDGYSSPALNYLEIAESNNLISGFTAATNLLGTGPDYIKRQWVIDGYVDDADAANRTKTLTFTWTSDDDNSFNWKDLQPNLFVGNATEGITGTFTNIAGVRKMVVNYPFSQTAPATAPTFKIGHIVDDTLPVELSSFMVSLNSYNKVQILWVTQSETNVSGFHIYRGTTEFIDEASCLDMFITATNTSQMQVYQYTDTEVTEDGTYYYWLENLDLDGSNMLHGPVQILLNATTTGTPNIPIIAGLNSVYPNPFNPTTTIEYGVPVNSQVEMIIYNLRGQIVNRLLKDSKGVGTYKITWNGNDTSNRPVSSGVYILKMTMGSKSWNKKLILSK